jgi:AraC-like DNA-binding protein
MAKALIRLRMAEACRRLCWTKRSVVGIALDVDCANPSHFAQLFSPGNRPARAVTAGTGDLHHQLCKNANLETRFRLNVLLRLFCLA